MHTGQGRFTLLTASDLAYMREVQNHNMPDRCDVLHYSQVSNGEGGYISTWVNRYTDIPCRLWISSGTSGTSEEARMWGAREVNVTEAFVICAWDINVDVKDRIAWRHTETGTERTFSVVGTNRHDTFTTATRCRVEGLRDVGT